MNNKILTYINFAIKSGQIVYGIDNIKAAKQKMTCVLFDSTATSRLENTIKTFCETKNILYAQLDVSIDELLKTKNCKVLGICNENLSKQIINIIKGV